MQFESEWKAEHQLSNVSYYRLSAYFLPFQIYGDPGHTYKKNTSFEKIFSLYLFDRELRLIAIDAIERIEISLRCKIIYEFSTRYGNNWYEDEAMYSNKNIFNGLMYALDKELNRTKETFILHYKHKYTDPPNPPAWMALEVLSFGQLSNMYKNLKNNDAKKAVADYFGIGYKILESWMEHLGYIRNICAHHSRLWNRTLTIKPIAPKVIKEKWIQTGNIRNDKVYISFAIMAYFINKITPGAYFVGKLRSLFHRFYEIDIKAAGFYEGWESDPFWKDINMPITYKVRIFCFICWRYMPKISGFRRLRA